MTDEQQKPEDTSAAGAQEDGSTPENPADALTAASAVNPPESNDAATTLEGAPEHGDDAPPEDGDDVVSRDVLRGGLSAPQTEDGELPVTDTATGEGAASGDDVAADAAAPAGSADAALDPAARDALLDDAGAAPDVVAAAPDAAAVTADTAEAAAMAAEELRAIVEALIFASPDPITPKTLYKLLATESKDAVSNAINELRAEYLNRPGLAMVEVAGGYQIVTRPELHEWVRRLFHERSTQKLSAAALETLAVIAYKQPVTALEVTEIRGVNASGVLSTLLERNLIKIVGRKNVVGRPFMYGTTKEFLIRFGLKDLGDLPKIEDMADALGFDPPFGLLEEITPREEMLPLDEEDAPAPAGASAPEAAQDEPQEPSAS